ncbi:hypothetical protein [Streptoalloteichus hindustanus]|uniref:Uncharacterized protein n=1 Tax=Streptoalloteichus hindustanus TaxID=2017 RepID=A0A1M5IZL8_STRHI|nr:hypothetical protein [Streptoalloteichus hindustanus]SHG33798.1 hypothetical protein SAMN05444320_10874 [Streptoalloteichus hindustanus]
MAEPISDRHVVAVLRPFVRATVPLLDAMRDADLFGLRSRTPDRDTESVDRTLRDKLLDGLASMNVPGTAAWAAMDVEHRSEWWVNRVGRVTALLAAVPGLGGALAQRLPVQDAMGVAGQGLVLCAIGGEHGLSVADRVRLLATVLFDRDVSPELAEGPRRRRTTVEVEEPEPAGEPEPIGEPGPAESAAAEEEQRTAELTEDLTESRRKFGKVTFRAVGRTVWKLGRALWSLGDELGKRPQGRFYHQAVGMVPVIGVVGNYLGERSALRRAAKRGAAWIRKNAPTPS